MKCADKQTFRTRRDAYEVARDIRRAGKRIKMYVYECRYCKQFHMTHYRPGRFDVRLSEKHSYNFKSVTDI